MIHDTLETNSRHRSCTSGLIVEAWNRRLSRGCQSVWEPAPSQEVHPADSILSAQGGALETFGAPIQAHGVTLADFETPENVYEIGLPPRRIDLMTGLSGVEFQEAWNSRIEVEIDGMQIPFLGLEALCRNKRATGRDKDLLDLRLLSESQTEED